MELTTTSTTELHTAEATTEATTSTKEPVITHTVTTEVPTTTEVTTTTEAPKFTTSYPYYYTPSID